MRVLWTDLPEGKNKTSETFSLVHSLLVCLKMKICLQGNVKYDKKQRRGWWELIRTSWIMNEVTQSWEFGGVCRTIPALGVKLFFILRRDEVQPDELWSLKHSKKPRWESQCGCTVTRDVSWIRNKQKAWNSAEKLYECLLFLSERLCSDLAGSNLVTSYVKIFHWPF